MPAIPADLLFFIWRTSSGGTGIRRRWRHLRGRSSEFCFLASSLSGAFWENIAATHGRVLPLRAPERPKFDGTGRARSLALPSSVSTVGFQFSPVGQHHFLNPDFRRACF